MIGVQTIGNATLVAYDKKIIEDYFGKFLSFNDKVEFISFTVGGKEFNLKFSGPKNVGISFEVPKHSLITACKYRVFDDLLIGNFMKTKLHNLRHLYEPKANFAFEIAKYADNGMAYSKQDLIKYNKFYAKKMGAEYFFDLFSNSCRDYFVYFFKNYQSSKYYNQLKKCYYFFLK